MDLLLRYIDAHGIRLAYFESKEQPTTNTTLLLVHGLGCHARSWDSTIKLLNASRRTICVELRGHGRSEKRTPYRCDQFGKDLCSFIQELDLQSIVAVGHSLGGYALLHAAALLTLRFEALLLLEPAVFHPIAYSDAVNPKMYGSPSEHPDAERRSLWGSTEEWLEFIKDRTPFKLWDSEVLSDHCKWGLEPAGNGQLKLCCPPQVTAEATMHMTDNNIHLLLPSVNVPTTVIRAKSAPVFRHPKDTVHSVTWPQLAENLPQAIDKQLDEVSHFIPMQRPDVVARELSVYLGDKEDT